MLYLCMRSSTFRIPFIFCNPQKTIICLLKSFFPNFRHYNYQSMVCQPYNDTTFHKKICNPVYPHARNLVRRIISSSDLIHISIHKSSFRSVNKKTFYIFFHPLLFSIQPPPPPSLYRCRRRIKT